MIMPKLNVSFVMDALYVEGAQVMSLAKLLMDGLSRSLYLGLRGLSIDYQIDFNPFTTITGPRGMEEICNGDIIILHLEVVKARGQGIPPQTKAFFRQLISYLQQLKESSDDIPKVIFIPATLLHENVPAEVYGLIRGREGNEFTTLFPLDWEKSDNFEKLITTMIKTTINLITSP